MTARWTRKDLLGLRDLSAEEINFILETADAFKQVGTREIKKVPALRGKTMVNFFVEPSTRTRISFELAALRLSADVINISAATSSLTKGETLKDTGRNIEALHTDILVLRHSSAGAPQFLASGSGQCDQRRGWRARAPTQALLDLFTIREKRGQIAGLRVAIIGDILFSRVARSNIFGLTKLGAQVTLIGPSTLIPREFEELGVAVSHKIDDVLSDADVVNLLRIQHERQRKEYFPGIGEYTGPVRADQRTGKMLKPDRLIMHPGPINRGVEIDSEVADSRRASSSIKSERPRRSHGCSVFVRRDRDVTTPTIIIRNGRIIDPANKRDEVADLAIVNGKIAQKSEGRGQKSEEIDAQGLIVAPGLIDSHVHLREPGFSHKETIATGARAAAAGGFATVVCMPNTSPVADNPSTIAWIKDRAEAKPA